MFRALPNADRVRDDWGSQSFTVKLEVDPDRANLAGVTNLDVALSSAVAMTPAPRRGRRRRGKSHPWRNNQLALNCFPPGLPLEEVAKQGESRKQRRRIDFYGAGVVPKLACSQP